MIETVGTLKTTIVADDERVYEICREFDNVDDRNLYVQSVIAQIFEKDISKNKRIRNRAAFEKIQTFIINNFGSTISVSNIVEYLAKENIAVKENTVHKYIEMLESAKIIFFQYICINITN